MKRNVQNIPQNHLACVLSGKESHTVGSKWYEGECMMAVYILSSEWGGRSTSVGTKAEAGQWEKEPCGLGTWL